MTWNMIAASEWGKTWVVKHDGARTRYYGPFWANWDDVLREICAAQNTAPAAERETALVCLEATLTTTYHRKPNGAKMRALWDEAQREAQGVFDA
jgi:hypothetical protein